MNKQIIARRLTLIQKNSGVRIDYTHVTEFHNVFVKALGKLCLLIEGETQDVADGRCYSCETVPIENLEFYIPKV